jgi:hypothetical protein
MRRGKSRHFVQIRNNSARTSIKLNDDEGGKGVWIRDEVRGEISQGPKSISIMNRPWHHFTSLITPTHAWTMVRVESGLCADERVKWSVQCGLRVVCLLFVLYLVRRLALGLTKFTLGRDSHIPDLSSCHQA